MKFVTLLLEVGILQNHDIPVAINHRVDDWVSRMDRRDALNHDWVEVRSRNIVPVTWQGATRAFLIDVAYVEKSEGLVDEERGD